jgi:hypothetical protein
MRIHDALRAGHAPLYDLLRHADEVARALPTLEAVQALAAALTATLVPHARAEDELFFAPLLAAGEPQGPLALMYDEHVEIETALGDAATAADRDTAAGHLLRAVALTLEHFEKEEELVFPGAEDALGPGEPERLGARWARCRR